MRCLWETCGTREATDTVSRRKPDNVTHQTQRFSFVGCGNTRFVEDIAGGRIVDEPMDCSTIVRENHRKVRMNWENFGGKTDI